MLDRFFLPLKAESFLDEEGYQKFLNKRKKIKKTESTTTVNGITSELPTLSKRKRKKLKKIQRSSEYKLGDTTTTDSVKDDRLSLTGEGNSKNMIQKIKDELDLGKIKDDASLSMVSSGEQITLTKNSKDRANPEVVVFQKHLKKKSISSDRKPDEENDLFEDRPELDLQRARYEVLKFGISGFEKQRKDEARIALAIKLGAKNRKLGLGPRNLSQKQR
ncbi:uncharacterized protein C1orf131 homolog [Limulus polyphemus]|uniref:Uncharacterized protein C1orf131 homolog n=1 Tax=Limulus polyphemus TaxID=6850 RepID=A0ABM1BE97_LIMPO|nr:uncharacterized protein C1orf131 homolog [Limulus polyphemus]